MRQKRKLFFLFLIIPISFTMLFTSQEVKAADNRQDIVNSAKKYIGTPYLWGGNSPSGFDCSGLVQYVFNNDNGFSLPRVTTAQENSGTLINIAEALPGDLYFWGPKGNSWHVGIAIGNNEFIHAPDVGDRVKITNIANFKPDFAIRMNLKNNNVAPLYRVIMKNLSLQSAQILVSRFQDQYGDNGKKIIPTSAIQGIQQPNGSYWVELRGMSLATAQILVQQLQNSYGDLGERLIPSSDILGETITDDIYQIVFHDLVLSDAQILVNELHRDYSNPSTRYLVKADDIYGFGNANGKIDVVLKGISFRNAQLLVQLLQNDYAINRHFIDISNIYGEKLN